MALSFRDALVMERVAHRTFDVYDKQGTLESQQLRQALWHLGLADGATAQVVAQQAAAERQVDRHQFALLARMHHAQIDPEARIRRCFETQASSVDTNGKPVLSMSEVRAALWLYGLEPTDAEATTILAELEAQATDTVGVEDYVPLVKRIESVQLPDEAAKPLAPTPAAADPVPAPAQAEAPPNPEASAQPEAGRHADATSQSGADASAQSGAERQAEAELVASELERQLRDREAQLQAAQREQVARRRQRLQKTAHLRALGRVVLAANEMSLGARTAHVPRIGFLGFASPASVSLAAAACALPLAPVGMCVVMREEGDAYVPALERQYNTQKAVLSIVATAQEVVDKATLVVVDVPLACAATFWSRIFRVPTLHLAPFLACRPAYWLACFESRGCHAAGWPSRHSLPSIFNRTTKFSLLSLPSPSRPSRHELHEC